jgi:hypothetical protein
MIFSLLLGLGIIAGSSPGLVDPSSLITKTRPLVKTPPPPVLVGWALPAQLDPTTDDAYPSFSTREHVTESDSEEEESVHFGFLSTSSARGLVAGNPPLDPRATISPAGNSLLHQIHHSWQLVC